jgi:acyl-CoA oxidase
MFTCAFLQSFVLNTPTLQSMKWWISGLGLAATHATVYAQLIIKGARLHMLAIAVIYVS